MRNLTGIAVLIACSTFSACGGGGGGGSSAAPLTLASAAIVIAGGSPAAGDLLVLTMSADVSLAAGAILDDDDLTLSSGTLGTVTAPPTLLNSRSVQVTLGAGVSLNPGTTTIAFGPDNDSVRDSNGNFATSGTAQTLTQGDGDNPTISQLTLNGIVDDLNGTGAAGGTLQVPRNGFTIDVTATDPSSALSASATILTADVTVGTVAAGGSLTSLFTSSTSGNTITYTVPGSMAFPDGAITLTASVVDITGMASPSVTFDFQVRNLDDAVRPFETSVNSSQVWFLDTSRDIESYTYNGSFPLSPVRVSAGSNSVPDLEDLYLICGLFGSSSSVNTTVRSQLQTRLLSDLATLFTGVNISFTFTSPGSFPGGSTSVAYNSTSFSQICIAGAEDTSGTTGVLGVAIFDPYNATQNDNCVTDFNGTQRLGVFVHTLVNASFGSPVGLFRTTYDPLATAVGGTPIGDAGDGLDAQRLSGAVNDARTTTITNAINRMARAIAVVAAHECGHSMGLVQDGAMPAGLYGGDSVNFPTSTSGHIFNASFLTLGAQNVMSPAVSFDSALDPDTTFNTLNTAYLTERAVHN